MTPLQVAKTALEKIGAYDLRRDDDATYRHVIDARTALARIAELEAQAKSCVLCYGDKVLRKLDDLGEPTGPSIRCPMCNAQPPAADAVMIVPALPIDPEADALADRMLSKARKALTPPAAEPAKGDER